MVMRDHAATVHGQAEMIVGGMRFQPDGRTWFAIDNRIVQQL